MKRRAFAAAGLLVCLVLLAPAGVPLAIAQEPAVAATSLPPSLLGTPTIFIENVGQFGAGARFQMWGGAGTVWLA